RKAGMEWSQLIHKDLRAGRDRAAVLHQFAEHGAKQKNGEELRHKLRGASHKGLRPTGEKRLARDRRRDERRGGGQQEHAPPPIGEPDQKKKGNEDAGKPHGNKRPSIRRRGRASSGAPGRLYFASRKPGPNGAPCRATCTRNPTQRSVWRTR